MKLRYLVLGAVLVGATGAYWWRHGNDDGLTPAQISQPNGRTVADAWDWRAFESGPRSKQQPASDRKRPFTVAGVHAALRQVRLDATGSLVIDHETLSALRAGFAELSGKLDDAQLAELRAIIRTGVPGFPGEQLANLVGSFHRYEAALPTFDQRNATPTSPSEALTQLDALIALRQTHFGPELTERLFGVEQAHTRYTLESMRIAALPNVSDEEKERMQSELRALARRRIAR